MTDTARRFETLSSRVQRIENALRRSGVQAIDMRRAGTLESDVLLPQIGGEQLADTPEIEYLEGTHDHIEQRSIPRQNATHFRWFIDGSQKTMPVWRIGVVPIVVSIAVAGLLERNAQGECYLVPGSLRESLIWIVPQQTNNGDIRALVDILEDLGQEVIDPLHGEDEYHRIAGIYDQVLFYANETAGKQRELAEFAIARAWEEAHRHDSGNDWLVIDGRLAIDTARAIGLIKNPQGQHLAGLDAVTLLNLPAGHRTTAYRTTSRASARTHFYQRMWPSEGLDARRALIRIELNGDDRDTEQFDEIASWLMAERVPTPKADSRWPTLLYPVHLLERMLKQRINAITAGWPV
ncbi:MAG: hypothetical protein KC435_05685 [Thermomicrobiales bacterium]|nr:hypothetical protein [Thermomicrobiales bacterium]